MKNQFTLFSAISLLGLFVITFLAGCQNVTDKLVQSATEKMVEGATGGQVKMDSENGQMNIKTKDGEVNIDTSNSDGTIKISGQDGQAIFGGGDTRPETAPADLPSLDGAKSFSWFGAKEGGILSFTVASTDFKAVCAQQMDLLVKSGWTKNDNFSMDVEKSSTRSFESGDSNLSLTCSGSEDETAIVMSKAQKS